MVKPPKERNGAIKQGGVIKRHKLKTRSSSTHQRSSRVVGLQTVAAKPAETAAALTEELF